MNVLSLFDGLSGAQIALEELGINIEKYFASEINNSSIRLTTHNYPNTCHLGDVKNVSAKLLTKVDLLIGGSPCQGFSINGNRLNFNDARSKLLFEFLRVRNETNPKFWLLENVATMNSVVKLEIDRLLGVKGVAMNSNHFVPQNRKRLYWTNIPFSLPIGVTEKKIISILDRDVDYNRYWNNKKISEQVISRTETDGVITLNPKKKDGSQTYQQDRIYDCCGRFVALTATLGDRFNIEDRTGKIRRLTIREQARLQGIPDKYCFDIISEREASEAIGNGFTIPAISHILKHIN